MRGTATSADRRYCRTVLPRVSRTFAINIRLLRGDLGEAVRTGYLLCRSADALEDSWPGSPSDVEERFDLLLAALDGDADAATELAGRAAGVAGGREDLGLVAELPRVLRVMTSLPDTHVVAVRDGVRTLASGMRRYAARAAGRPPVVPYVDTEVELHDYCYVVAGCVGEMLTRLLETGISTEDPERARRRMALAPAVGEALQLTNILLDWPSDIRRGRCYVPAAWLAERDLEPRDLVDRDRPEVREVARRLEALARAALARVPDYLDLVPARFVRYRLFCLWPTLWALASLRHARRDPEFPWGARRPRLPRGALWRSVVASAFALPGGAALRRLWAAHA